MSVAFLPLAIGIMAIHGIPAGPRVALAVATVGALWWGPFGYAMYLSMAVMRNGDRRLLKRGIAGTAEVLSAKATRTVIQEGEFAWEAPRVYKYRLRVHIPGKQAYETDCSICAAGIREGSVVNVAVSPHNRHRVTIDVGQGSKGGARVPRPVSSDGVVTSSFPAGAGGFAMDPGEPASADAQRIDLLDRLGKLHRQGVLTDAEFAAQKAQILGE